MRETRTPNVEPRADRPFLMIQGNQTWQMALAQLQKQPLYVLQIPDFGVILASFSTSAVGVAVAGYGVGGYGVAGYGT